MYVTLFVPWIPLCSSVRLGFSPKTVPSAEAVIVSIIDMALPLSKKAYVLIDSPSLESVPGIFWRSDGLSEDAEVLQFVEFADWVNSSWKCVCWRSQQLQRLCFAGHSFDERPSVRQLKQAFCWQMASLRCLTDMFLNFCPKLFCGRRLRIDPLNTCRFEERFVLLLTVVADLRNFWSVFDFNCVHY